jgi:hypothetical protein
MSYSKEENAIVERANKEINRHITAMCFDKQIVDDWESTIPIVHRIINSHRNSRTGISPADILFGNALNLDRGIFVSLEEQNTLPSKLSASTSKMLASQHRLIEIHRTLMKEHDDAHISSSTPSEITEFSINSYVLLEPVLTPLKQGRTNTRRTGPFLVTGISGNTYTLDNLVTKKSVRVHINRLVPFIFDPTKTNPQLVAARDSNEYHIEMITSHRGRFTNKRKLEFKVHWAGYDETYDTWEPWKNLKETDKLHEYLRLINLPNEIPNNFR